MLTAAKTPLDRRREVLLARVAELDARLETIESTLDAPHERDWEELAIEREGEEVLEATGLAGQSELARIRAALRRIEAGSYGICARCGGTIAEARLDALPFTPLCRACAE